ncbi:MAG: hypothetical protein JWO94_3443 [Verrucomicrobiaceae bacterium]|nr:hypothetical protein [Verrucomicrobiaceae bacterium]
MSQFLIVVGLIVLAYACRTIENRFVAKAGWLAMLAATYLGAFFLTGSHLAGATALILWFFLPWLEILGRVRKLRFPTAGEVKQRFPPSREAFPELDELSSEAESAGFVETEDAGWKWDETDHFMRLFYHAEQRLQAAVILATQEDFALSYVSLTSRTQDGGTFTTSNYPFSFTMKFSPQHRVNRYTSAASFDDLLASHAHFLEAQAVKTEGLEALNAEDLSQYVTRDMQGQIEHNVRVGLLVPAGEGFIRYSWRGYVFLWLQVVKDMIRV